MCNYSQGVNDESVKRNAEFLGNSGVKAYIIRTTTGKCCQWCTNIAGKYEYGQEPRDIYRRHANCDCVVEYVVDGKSQNVHTKQWATEEEIEARKNIEPPRPSREEVEKLKNLNIENGRGSGIIEKKDISKEEKYYYEVSATGKNKFTKKNFLSVKKKKEHINKHLSEFKKDGINNEKGYINRAIELLESPTSKNIVGHVDEKNCIIRYDIRKNDFAKGTPDKGIKTLFKPKRGIDYYNDQKKKDLENGGRDTDDRSEEDE